MTWSWRLETSDGAAVDGVPSEKFPSQADAESWIGQTWRDLATTGVTAVTLVEDDRVDYRMSLRPTE